MATLSPGVRAADEFCLATSDVVDVVDSEDRWGAMTEALRRRGVRVGATSGDVSMAMLSRLRRCKTCGEALALFAPEPHQRLQDDDLKAAKGAWGIEYVAPEPVLDLVAEQLRDYSSRWNKCEMYAPLAALVQSSGWGKSRLMCQLWRRGFYVFYLSCMSEQQTGFPRRTEKLADIVQNNSSTEATFVALVLGILTVLNTHGEHMTCQQWIEAQQESSVIQKKVHDVYVEKLKTISEYGLLHHDGVEDKIELTVKQETDKLAAQAKRLLLCVDEAGELGENFVTLRRSLRSIPQGSSFFCVALGTDRKVADLAAASEHDASARMRLARPYNVYHPLCLIGKSDIFAKEGADICKASVAREDVLRYGRPLWAAYYDSVGYANKLNATIQLAKLKLLGRNVNTSEPGWVTQDIAVAVFAHILGLDVVAWGSLPQQLVAKHMRTIVKISNDRRRVYTAAAVEPALAAAAAELLHAQNDAFLGEFLEKLIVVLLDGLVLEGIRGEVASRIIMMLAMHECTKDQQYIQQVTLVEFLETMFEGSIVDKLKQNCCNLDGYLFFNSFTPISVEPFARLVEEAYARCTALIARRNEEILDIALPFQYRVSDVGAARPMQETVKAELEDYEKKAIVVPIQVKNRRNKPSMKSAIERLQNDDRVSSPVQLLFQLGQNGGPTPEVDNDTVVCYGIDCFQHLKSEKMQKLKVLDKLKLLLRTCEDIFKDVTSEEQAVLEDMVPFGLASKSFVDEMKEGKEPYPPMKWKTKKRTSTSHPRNVQSVFAGGVHMGEPSTKVKRMEDVAMEEADKGME